ncbi:MAG: hypothetical protein ACPG77_03620, partial [Nannocystaceae bacterium]
RTRDAPFLRGNSTVDIDSEMPRFVSELPNPSSLVWQRVVYSRQLSIWIPRSLVLAASSVLAATADIDTEVPRFASELCIRGNCRYRYRDAGDVLATVETVAEMSRWRRALDSL